MDDSLVYDLIKDSYTLVASKLPKAVRHKYV